MPDSNAFRGIAASTFWSGLYEYATATQLLVYTNTASQVAMRRSGNYNSSGNQTTVQLFGYFDFRDG
jgi:hypothetical protein